MRTTRKLGTSRIPLMWTRRTRCGLHSEDPPSMRRRGRGECEGLFSVATEMGKRAGGGGGGGGGYNKDYI